MTRFSALVLWLLFGATVPATAQQVPLVDPANYPSAPAPFPVGATAPPVAAATEAEPVVWRPARKTAGAHIALGRPEPITAPRTTPQDVPLYAPPASLQDNLRLVSFDLPAPGPLSAAPAPPGPMLTAPILTAPILPAPATLAPAQPTSAQTTAAQMPSAQPAFQPANATPPPTGEMFPVPFLADTAPAGAGAGGAVWNPHPDEVYPTSQQQDGTEPTTNFGAPYTQPELFFFNAEYLLYWEKGMRLPPLVTTGSPTTPEDFRGALGANGTQLLFGGNTQPARLQSGARFTAGLVLDDCGCWIVEASGFFLGQGTEHFRATSDQFPVLARPIFNVNLGREDRQLTTTPGLLPADAFRLTGSIAVDTFTRFWGAEANLRHQVCADCNYTFSWLVGFRTQGLDEGVHIWESAVSQKSVPGLPFFNAGNQLSLLDSFETRNRFYGAQVGGLLQLHRGNWFLDANVKFALGDTEQQINVNGFQAVTTPAGVKQTFMGGLLALPSNMGRFERDRLSFLTDVGLKLGYNVTDTFRVYAGYDFLYWNGVVRPGDQIDRVINVAQVPNFGPAPASNVVRPIVPFRVTDFWAQGFRVGLEFRY